MVYLCIGFERLLVYDMLCFSWYPGAGAKERVSPDPDPFLNRREQRRACCFSASELSILEEIPLKEIGDAGYRG